MYRKTTCWCLRSVLSDYGNCVDDSPWITIDLQQNVPAVRAQLSPSQQQLQTSSALAEDDDDDI
jgi:hypothetical protein